MVTFRKSVKVGPLRFTLSPRGVSTSAGMPGAHISLGSDGKVRRTLSLPGTGIYDTQVLGGVGRRTGRASPAVEWPAPAGPLATVWQRRLVRARLARAGVRSPSLAGLTIGQAALLLYQVGADTADLWRGGRAWGKRGRATWDWLQEMWQQQGSSGGPE